MSGGGMANWESSLSDQVVLVTGGSGGLGRGVVKLLMEAGAELHVPIYDEEEISELEAFLGDAFQGIHLHRSVDLTRTEDVAELFETIVEGSGRSPDTVVNLAGGFAMSAIEDTDPRTWTRMWQMNASTVFLVSREAVAGMKARGWGRIVNISALPALEGGSKGLSAYGAAKAAVLNLTRTLAREGVEHGITVNAILPSIIDTPGNREAMPDADRSRWVDPVDIARVVRFLVSKEARVVNGAMIRVTLGPA